MSWWTKTVFPLERRETLYPYLSGIRESERDSLWSENSTSPVLCSKFHSLLNLVLFIFFPSRPAALIYLPYTDIIKAAGVRLPAHLWWCGAVGFGLSAAPLFTHP
ncbi:hypothetical protein [Flavonifractor phage Chenonceau]|nr:hypothetical protein [Flavonifractor phage Chenonceau]DAL91104.1 MAG TPA: hypothetical protein [Caudoviricetes sp.]